MAGLDVSKLPLDLALNILNIVLMFLIVRGLVYKPVKKFLNARKDRMEAEKAQAEKTMAEAEQMKARFEASLADSRAEAQKIIDDSAAAAKQNSEAIIAKANEQAGEIVDTARKKAEEQRQKMLSDMRGEVVDIAFGISEKILEKNISDSENRAFADKLFETENAGQRGKADE